ncbi:MAG: ABC transporter ATP-binding protein [Planctomycetota bacterium]
MTISDSPLADCPLRCSGIRRSFEVGDRRLEVLHGVQLELGAGERLALMGSSGAGKTTLLNILGLLDRPTEGEVVVEGTSAWSLSPAKRAELRNRRIGFVFQFYHLLPELSALENAILPAMILFKGSEFRRRRDEFESKANDMLVRFGLAARLGHKPGQLSGGEQQRVAIARALLLDPPILIADEPTGNLDSGTGEKVLEILLDEQKERGVSLLLVTHDERLAARCERVLYMQDGLIQADSSAPMPT